MAREGAPCPKPEKLRRSWFPTWSAIAGWRVRTKIEFWRGSARSAATLTTPSSPCIMAASSSAPATAASLSSAASSMPCASRSKCRARWSSAMPKCRWTGASSFALAFISATWSRSGDGDLMGDGVNIAARIESIAEPGAICLSEDAYRQVKGRLDLAVADLGPTQLKNIAEPMRVYSLRLGVPAQAKPAEPVTSVAPKKHSALLPLAIGIAALLVLIGGAGWWFVNANRPAAVASETPAEAARISLVVLPFTNLSNDPAQEYFADGVTENLTTELSRLHNSFVIARNTAFTFKGKNVDAKAIGKELSVRYFLEGSVQRDANRVRLNAQLIDAESGAHLWADRFDEDVVDLFKLQDEVVARLARTLQVELVSAEAQRSLHDHSQNPDAIDLTMRGSALLSQPLTKANRFGARDLFEQALTLDPTNADALAGAAFVDATDYALGWSDQSTRVVCAGDAAR